VTSQQTDDWSYHDKALFNRDEAERSAVLQALADGYPRISNLIRWSGSGVVVTTIFEKTAALAHAILLINPSADEPFSVILYADKLEFDRSISLRSGTSPGGPDVAGTAFYRAFTDRLGKSLSQTPDTGARH
jgi:hypothetical protein